MRTFKESDLSMFELWGSVYFSPSVNHTSSSQVIGTCVRPHQSDHKFGNTSLEACDIKLLETFAQPQVSKRLTNVFQVH